MRDSLRPSKAPLTPTLSPTLSPPAGRGRSLIRSRPSPSRPTRRGCGSTASSRRAFRGSPSAISSASSARARCGSNGKRAEAEGPARSRAGGARSAAQARRSRSRGAGRSAKPRRTRALPRARSRSTRTTTCSCSTSRSASPCRAAPAPRAMSTACSDVLRDRRTASGRASCTGSTRTPPAAWSSPRSRFAAAALAKTFRSRSARKIYWALVAGVPKLRQGRISTYLAKEEGEDGDSACASPSMARKARAMRVTYYAVVETAGPAARLAVAEAGDRPHPPVARPYRPYRPSDRRRPEIFRQGELGAARRHAEPAASAGASHRRAASARRGRSTSPRRCRRIWSSRGTCSASTRTRYDPIEDSPEE